MTKLSKTRRRTAPKTARTRTCNRIIKNTIVTVIIIAVTTVVAAIICAFLFRPSHQIPLKIENLAANYYENVFYENMLNSPNFSGDAEKALSIHSARGLSPITLRQLILNENLALPSADAEYLLEYCDAEATRVKFYPDPPYSRTAYHTDITYSCNF